MTTTPDIEAIVRDVLRRLAPTTGEAAPTHRAPVGEKAAANKLPPAATPAQPAAEITLSQRVITVDTLRGKLANIQQVRVAQAALVTPLAADELQQRGVALLRGEGNATKPNQSYEAAVLSVAAIGRLDASGLARQLGAGQPQAFDDIAAALSTLASSVAAGHRLIVLSEQPARVVCQANRREPLRAAWAVDVASARDAVETAAANLLVLEPRRHSLMQMVNIGRAYRQARPA